MILKKAGGNWVDGDRFFDRDAELEALTERVKDGTHTLLTAQRRMGKTSLVRELMRCLKDGDSFETIFIDLEDALTPADAISEIGARSKSVQGVQPSLIWRTPSPQRTPSPRLGLGQSRSRAYSASSNLGLPTLYARPSIESIRWLFPRCR